MNQIVKATQAAGLKHLNIEMLSRFGDVSIFGPGSCGGWRAHITIGAGSATLEIKSKHKCATMDAAVDSLIVEFKKTLTEDQ